MFQKRIVIVNDGDFKKQDSKHYLSYCESLKDIFEKVKMVDEGGRDTDTPAATVSVVETAAEARNLVVAKKVDMVIFVSAGMYIAAGRIQFDFPELQVLNFSGRPVKNQPFFIPKRLVTLEGIRRVVLQM